MKIRPLRDRLLVRHIDEEEMTKGGIIIPDTAKEKPQEGNVTAVGKGRVAEDGKLRPLDVHKGDRVLFSPQPIQRSRSSSHRCHALDANAFCSVRSVR